MNRIPKWRLAPITFIRKSRIPKRLAITFVIVSILPIIGIGVYAYNIYTHSINEKIARSTRQAVTLVNNNLMIQLQKYQELCGTISTNEIVQNNLPIWYSLDAIGRRQVSIAADNVLNDKAPLLSYVNNVRILNDQRQVVYDMGFDDIPVSRYHEILADVDRCSPNDSLRYAKTYRAVDNIVLGRKIFNQYSGSRHIGYVLISLNEKLFSQNIMGGIDLGTGSELMILDRDGHIVSSGKKGVALGAAYPDGDLIRTVSANQDSGTHSVGAQLNKQQSLITYVYNESIGWYLVSVVPFSYINSETKSINENLVILSCAILFLCLNIIFFIYTSIIGPIKRINTYCRRVENGEMDHQINDGSPDEMGALSRSVEHMVGEIQQLIDRQNQDQKRQRELELNMLQSQINPHFLFNTLNTLKWIAIINQVPVLSDGITSLADLLRNTILNKEEKITIREEIKNIDNYIAIQKIRYADNFFIEYKVDERSLENHIPKFILQPMVENAIIHGSYDNGRKITIEIVVKQQGETIMIEINDNGRGFEPNGYESGGKLSGIGIQNVDERIKLYYGEGYGLDITSKKDEGTRCTITFPKES